jgi:hypothetical protein
MTLINYGIQDEQSDWRIHISVCNNTAYIFQTKDGKREVENGRYRLRPVFQRGIKTAMGAAVPIGNIPGILKIFIPYSILRQVGFAPEDGTSEKGKKAAQVVVEMLKLGLLPFFGSFKEITDTGLQIRGTDIQVGAVRIQVKCDWNAGNTGNIYLQTQECNPFHKH